MNNLQRKTISTTLLMVVVINLSACSVFSRVTGFFGQGDEVDYQNNQTVKLLEIPPGLSTPDFDDSLALPRSAYGNNTQVATADISPPSFDSSVAVNGNNTALRSYNGVPSSNYVSGAPSSIVDPSGRAVLRVHSDYPNSIQATQDNLKKMGFEIVRQDSGVITAKYTEDAVLVSDSKVSDFLKYIDIGGERKRLIKFDAALDTDLVYLVSVTDEQSGSIVRFTRADGTQLSDEAHRKIIRVLNTTFNS